MHREAGYRLGEAGDLGSLALVYEDLGDWEKSFCCTREALRIDEEIGYHEGKATDLGNLGGLYFRAGYLAEARQFHEQALAIHRALGHRQGEAKDMGNIALVAYRALDLEEAQQHCEAALRLQRQLGSPEGQLEQLLNLAVIHQAREDFTAALCLQDEALEMAHPLRNRDGLFRGLVGRGDTYVRQGDPHMAHADYREAIEIIEELRGHLVTEENRIGFLRGGKATVYQRMVQLVWGALRRPGEALEYSERARSRALLELLATTPLASPAEADPTVLAEEQVLIRALRVQQQALRSATNERQRWAVAAEIASGQQKLRRTTEALLGAAPEYAALRQGHPLSVAGIKGLLRNVR
jgi:tetratricopeptide (TPR) repeat protein